MTPFWGVGTGMGTHLTDTQVKNAKLPEGKSEHSLTDLPGLYVRLRLNRDGSISKTWRYRYTFHGKGQWMVLGTYPTMSVADARESLLKQQAVLAKGDDPAQVRDMELEKKSAEVALARLGMRPETLDDLFNKWLNDYASKEHSDQGKLVSDRYRNHVKPHLGKLRLELLRPASFSDLLNKVKDTGKKAKVSKGHARTVGLVLSMLKQMFGWGMRTGHITQDPVAYLEPKDYGASKGEPGERVLTEDELKLLYHLVEHSTMTQHWRHLTWLMLACGTRVGEMLLAQAKHIDLESGTWIFPKENQKHRRGVTPRDHTVYLSPFALHHVEALLALAKKRRRAAEKSNKLHPTTGAFLFPSRLKSGGESAPNEKTFTHLVNDRQADTPKDGRTQSSDELKLPGGHWNSHDLRRTASTLMRKLGTSPEVTDACLNHVVGTELQRIYQKHEALEEMKTAWFKLGEKLEQLRVAALADKDTGHLVKQRAIQRKAVKLSAQAKKMAQTKALRKAGRTIA